MKNIASTTSPAGMSTTSAAMPTALAIPTLDGVSIRVDKMDNSKNNGQIIINSMSSNQQTVLGKRDHSSIDVSEHDINEGSSMYHLQTPNSSAEWPHKPKLRKHQIEALNQLFHFGTSYSGNNPITVDLYNNYKEDQKQNISIKGLGVFDYLVKVLDSDSPFDSFLEKLWTENHYTDLDDHGEAFKQIINHTLTTFHLVSRALTISPSNHERTHFVENIIPSLLAFGKLTKFLEFKWCETEFTSSKILNLKDCDYDLRSAPPSKLIDALGTLVTQNNMELVIVEVSSGISKENTTHSIEDTLKTLECAVASLRKEAAHYQQASLETFKKLKVYGIHVIKTQVTLTEISLYDETHWKCVELRTAWLPTLWNDRLFLVQYIELLATLYNACQCIQQTLKQLSKEHMGLVSFEGPSVGSIMKNNSL